MSASARFSIVKATVSTVAVLLVAGLLWIGAMSAYRWWRPQSICEVSAVRDTSQKWQELRIVHQGRQELINFRSISKENTIAFVFAIYLSGEKELEVFRTVMDEYLRLVSSDSSKLEAMKRTRLGRTSQHEFWLSFLSDGPVLEYSDSKNFKRGGMSMLSTETVQTFQKLSEQYTLLHSTLRRITSKEF